MKVEFKKVKLKDAIKLKTYKIKNHDSGKTYKVKAKSFNDAKDKYNKMIVNDGKLVEVSEKYLSKFVSEIEKIGFKVDSKGKTWSGAIHYQIITKTGNNDEFTLKKMAQALSKISKLFYETYNIPVTYNVGLQTDGYISAGVDLRQQYVKDSFKINDEITNIVKQVKSKFDVSATFKSDKNSQTLEITEWKENDTAKLKQYINQQLSNIDNFNKKGTNENDSLVWSWKKENVKDSFTEDVVTEYEVGKYNKEWGVFAKRCRAWVAFGTKEKMTELAKRLNELEKKQLNELEKKQRQDSLTEDDNTFMKAEIDELSRYVRNWDFMSKQERNNVMPGYSKSEGLTALKIKLAKAEASLKKDSLTEDAISKLVQNYLGSKKPKTKAEQDEIINFLLEKNKITKEDVQKVRSLLKIVKDSITEDAETYSYQFPPLTAKDLKRARDYELLEVKKVGKDVVLKGSLGNLKRFAEKYLGYELVKKYLTKDSITEDSIKSYKIKNHDSGQTFRVNAVSYTDAIKKYNEHILKDSITEDAEKYREFKLYKNGTDWEVESSDGTQWNYDGSMSLQEVKKAIDKGLRTGNWEDSITEDAATNDSHYLESNKQYMTKLWNKKDVFERKYKVAITRQGEGHYIEGSRKNLVSLLQELRGSDFNANPFIHDSITEDADSLAKWREIGRQIESLFKRYVDKTVGRTVIDRVYRDISSPYADELTFGVSSNINFAQKDITSLINSHKQDIERIYSKKLVEVKMLRLSNAAKNQVASISFLLKFDGDIWKDSITEDANITVDTWNAFIDKHYNSSNHWDYAYIGDIDDVNNNDDFSRQEEKELQRKYKYFLLSTRGEYSFFTSESAALQAAKKSWPDIVNAINKQTKDSINDADIAQTDIKSSYLPEDANAENIKYLGFNELRKISFYQYGDNFYAHYDLTGAVEKIDKDAVQRILKKNIIGEIDEDILTQKQSKNEEIVKDSDYERYTLKTGRRSDAFKQYLRDRGLKFEPSQNGNYTEFVVFNADESVDRRVNEIIKTISDAFEDARDFKSGDIVHLKGYPANAELELVSRNSKGAWEAEPIPGSSLQKTYYLMSEYFDSTVADKLIGNGEVHFRYKGGRVITGAWNKNKLNEREISSILNKYNCKREQERWNDIVFSTRIGNEENLCKAFNEINPSYSVSELLSFHDSKERGDK